MNKLLNTHQSWPGTATSIVDTSVQERRQFFELLKIGLRQGFRPAINETGKKSRPLRTLLGTMPMFGFVLLVNAWFYADLATYFTMIFTTALSIQLIGVFPVKTTLETATEILHSKPISSRVHMAASISQRFLIAAIICTSYAAVPLIASRWYFSAAGATIAGTYVMLIVLSFSSLVIAFAIIVELSSWSGYPRFQIAAKYLLLATTLVVVVPALTAGFARGFHTHKFSIWSYDFINWFPPVWFATFLVPDGVPFLSRQRVAVIVLVCLAILLCFRKRSYSQFSGLLERMNSIGNAALRLPVAFRFATVIARAVSRRRLGRVFALASVMLLQSNREETFGLRKGSLIAAQGIFFVLFLFHPGTYFLLAVIMYGVYNVVEGIRMVSSSSFSSASWLFGAAPASSKQMIRGMEVAILFGNSLLPGLLVSVSLCRAYRPGLATALVLIFLIYARILISSALILRPRLPLSGDATGKHGLGYLLYSIVGDLGLLGIFLAIIQISRFSSPIGLGVSLAAIVALAGASWLMTMWACNRMTGVESYN